MKNSPRNNDCYILLLFCYNQVSYDTFKEIFLETYNVSPDAEEYLYDKWDHFVRSMTSFLIQHPEFMERVQARIKKLGYKG